MKEKNPKKFSIKMQKKLLCLYVLIILAFILLSFRLSWIVRADGADYEKQVLSQQKYDSITLPFRRGDIVDAKGTKLAVSEKVYNLVIDSRVMLDREDYLEPTMEALAANFPGSGHDGGAAVCNISSRIFLVCASSEDDL